MQNVPDASALKAIDDAALVSLLMVELHQGEAEAIALALDLKAKRLLIDEREGRMMARQLGLSPMGVLGVLLRAKKMKQIKTVKSEINALKNKARFFIAPALESAILLEARE